MELAMSLRVYVAEATPYICDNGKVRIATVVDIEWLAVRSGLKHPQRIIRAGGD